MRNDEIGEWPEELTPRQKAFLETYSRHGSVKRASEGICNRLTHYKWLRESDVYCQAFQTARNVFGDNLMELATRLATEGEQVPIIQKGRLLKDDAGNAITRTRRDRALLRHLMRLNRDTWLESRLHHLTTQQPNDLTPCATQSYTNDPMKSKSKRPYWKEGIPLPSPLNPEP